VPKRKTHFSKTKLDKKFFGGGYTSPLFLFVLFFLFLFNFFFLIFFSLSLLQRIKKGGIVSF
jgi:hypothetical protein